MKHLVLLILLALAFPRLSLAWTELKPATLGSSSGTATVAVGEKLDPVDKIRLRIDGGTVRMANLILVPVQGEEIVLRVPAQLKSGESSGLIHVPGPAVAAKSFKLRYKITAGGPATLTLRVRAN